MVILFVRRVNIDTTIGKNSMTKARLFQVLALTVSLTLLAFSQQSFAETEDEGHLVSTEQVKKEQVSPSVWLPANVISRKNAPISAEQTGQLLWIEEVGSQVSKGQLLAQIDDRHLKLQLARQQAQVKQHQADVDYLTGQKARFLSLREKKQFRHK